LIQVIAFDLDDTLWSVGPIIFKAERRLNDWLQQEVPQILYDVDSMRSLHHELLELEPDLGNKITESRRRLIERALLLSKINIDEATELSHQAMDVFLEARNEIVFFEGALEAISLLANQFTLGALTNGNADIKKIGLDSYFSFAFSAEEVGAPKPAENLFRQALAHTNTRPQQMLYVGDNPVLDIDVANNIGMHTVWIKHPGQENTGETSADEAIEHISDLPQAVNRILSRFNADHVGE
jgi:putative hydrolase of the HAD superfamily|tara:strand:- start:6170 stop:6889 length:720 start_codon:yes stop_codon:yes gene_type:complete